MQAAGVPAAQEASMHMWAAAKQRAALAPDWRVLCSESGIIVMVTIACIPGSTVQSTGLCTLRMKKTIHESMTTHL